MSGEEERPRSERDADEDERSKANVKLGVESWRYSG